MNTAHVPEPGRDATRVTARGAAPLEAPLEARARGAIARAIENLRRLQADDGHWPGDYGGPMFLLPMLVALYHVTNTVDRVPAARRARMVDYFTGVQHEDGSVGLHAEDPRGMLFCTVLSYVAMRVLGVPAGDPRMVRMRSWIRAHGGPTGAAPWGKWVLCILGLHDWSGVAPVLPELWLLPEALPFHPSRLWCHCRQVYLPVAWLYGMRATAREDALVRALRDELYAGGYDTVDWVAARHALSPTDSYRRHSGALRGMNAVLGAFEAVAPRPLRRRALRAVFEHIAYEDDVTDGIDIGPVNKVMNAFVHYFDDPDGRRFERALERTDDYLWDAPDGTKMQGYNGSQLWDTAFATQALLASSGLSPASGGPAGLSPASGGPAGLAPASGGPAGLSPASGGPAGLAPASGGPPVEDHADDVLARAYGYIRDNQILEDVPERERFYRHASRGGWPFSTRAHGWPITDCTSEGLKCALALAGRYRPEIPAPLLEDSVRLLLSWQNDDGGWATYERQRGGAWLERLNPSEVFGDIMVDYSYVECTSACIQALTAALRSGKALGLRVEERAVRRAVERGVAFLRKAQLRDGSFEGSWAVCFTYGTWFGVTGLLAGGVPRSDASIQRACAFLLQRQRSDGGWGEDGDSCRERRWVEAADAHVVQTSWALLTLVDAGHPDRGAMHRAAELLVSRQVSDLPSAGVQGTPGGWPKEPLVGVFNRTCLIDYDNYRQYFPLWALSAYVRSGSPRA